MAWLRGGATLVFLLLVAAGTCSCSEDAPATGPDAGSTLGTATLWPDGHSEVGLAFDTSAVLRVRYLDASGSPRPGAEIEFALAGETAGSTLSSPTDETDVSGIAGVEVRAGRRETTFQVRATAAAATAVFVISVNESGEFAMLEVRSTVRQGLGVSGPFAVRLYDDQQCSGISPVEPPPTPPPRTKIADDMLSPVTFGPLLASRDYAVLVTPAGGGLPDFSGCVDLLGDRLITGETVLVLVPIALRKPMLPEVYVLTTHLPLGKLTEVAWAFAPLSCPYAPGGIILDCLIDARDARDPLDCVPEEHDVIDGAALELHRGEVDLDGCRGPEAGPGVPSLEALLHEHLMGSDPVTVTALAAATAPTQVAITLGDLTLHSSLHLDPTPAAGHWVATHSFQDATLGDQEGLATHTMSLASLGAPHLTAVGVPLHLTETGSLEVGRHEVSLRLGTLARTAAEVLVFQAHGLPRDSQSLVELLSGALAAGYADPCAALDEILCSGAGLGSGCIDDECPAALDALPAAIDAQLLALDGEDDLVLQGRAQPTAGASGPVAEFLVGGSWEAEVGPAVPRTATTAAFSGAPAPSSATIEE